LSEELRHVLIFVYVSGDPRSYFKDSNLFAFFELHDLRRLKNQQLQMWGQ
jgi:hypothetical protein